MNMLDEFLDEVLGKYDYEILPLGHAQAFYLEVLLHSHPIETRNSLHIYEEVYSHGKDEYLCLLPFGDALPCEVSIRTLRKRKDPIQLELF